MKPKNKIQSRLVELSGQLRPLTTPQMEWAFRNTHEHFAYRLKGGKCTCMDCGAEFIETRDGRCFCPECHNEGRVSGGQDVDVAIRNAQGSESQASLS